MSHVEPFLSIIQKYNKRTKDTENSQNEHILTTFDPDSISFIKSNKSYMIAIETIGGHYAVDAKAQLCLKVGRDFNFRLIRKLKEADLTKFLSHFEDVLEMSIGEFTDYKINYMTQHDIDMTDMIYIDWSGLYKHTISFPKLQINKVFHQAKTRQMSANWTLDSLEDLYKDIIDSPYKHKKKKLKGKTVDPKLKPWMKLNKSDFTKRH
jgi:hypothetical protein